MSKKYISNALIISLVLINICYGMDEQEGGGRRRSKSYIVKRKKDEKKDVVVSRRQSESSALGDLLNDTKKKEYTRQRTFSLLTKLHLKSQHTSAETVFDESGSVPKTPHSSVSGDAQAVQEVGLMLALSRKVATSGESTEVAAEPVKGAAVARQRMSVTVPVPKRNDSQEPIFELKKVLVSPQEEVAPAPAVNPAQRALSSKALLLRTAFANGRWGGRDSQTRVTARELLGRHGEAALFANPSPGQSPRSEDIVTPRSDDSNTPRSEDTPSPRVDEEK